MTNTDLSPIIDSLITLGEDRDELEFWKTIYPNLSPNEQKDLKENLTTELEKLRQTLKK